ncbi:MAG TPA: hypothetical protein G4O09_01455 [Dehalococcoidia bacterium]|nr:hypothetical protein [Dehalococcoidia bacterium]
MYISANFPENIEENAFRMRSEYAWQKKDLEPVFNHCVKANIAILGGETWIVRRILECKSDEPTEPKHVFNPKYRQDVSLLGRTQTHVIYGIFPFRDGTNGLFPWSTISRSSEQAWQDYVIATVEETKDIITKGNIEERVIPEYSQQVYYNLCFMREDGSSF